MCLLFELLVMVRLLLLLLVAAALAEVEHLRREMVSYGVRCQVCVRCQVPGVRCQESGIRCQVLGPTCVGRTRVLLLNPCCAAICTHIEGRGGGGGMKEDCA
jgi:hypothetical protein